MRTGKRLFCIAVVILALLMDTSVLPFIGINTAYCPRLSLISVLMIALLTGKTQGMIYGGLSGVLLGYTVYTPAQFTIIIYTICGLIAGFLGKHVKALLLTVVPVVISLFVYEFVYMVYYYFSSGTLEVSMIFSALIRIAVGLIVSQLIYFPFVAVLKPKKRKISKTKQIEVD